MTVPEETTVIFVPGAWHLPIYYDEVKDLIKKAGYNVDYVYLPSVGPEKHLQDFGPDVAKIRSQITTAVEAGQDVVLVAHSYGGVPACEAVKGLDKKSRTAQGKPGGVSHIVFCCAFILDEGVSLWDAVGHQVLPWHLISEDQLEILPDTPRDIFYNDLSDEQVQTAISRLKPFSFQCFMSKLSYAAWKHVPSTYLYCLKDQAIPIEYQRLMVEGTVAKTGETMNTETLDASHSPMMKMPQETAMAIRRAAGEKV